MDADQQTLLALYMEYAHNLRELIRNAPSLDVLRTTELRISLIYQTAAKPFLEMERLKSEQITGAPN